MSFNVVFIVSLAATVLLLLRLKQSLIVTVGGGLILASIVGLILGKPERINREVDPAIVKDSLVNSNDYEVYKEIFTDTSLRLIREGKCNASDFKEIGGWVRAANHSRKNTYFTYCGGMTVGNRIYLDAQTGETFL